MSGTTLGVIVTVLLFTGGLMQAAVIRDRSIPLSRSVTSSRWLMVVGVWGLAFRFGYLMWDGSFAVPWHSLISIGLIGLALIGMEMQRFVPLDFAETEQTTPTPFDEQPTQEGPSR